MNWKCVLAGLIKLDPNGHPVITSPNYRILDNKIHQKEAKKKTNNGINKKKGMGKDGRVMAKVLNLINQNKVNKENTKVEGKLDKVASRKVELHNKAVVHQPIEPPPILPLKARGKRLPPTTSEKN